ncbi:MAG: phosphatidylglycerophosphatase A [Holosporaceae bacterium]|nr:MAG: phosphatidylglycerophosphatase A [Holosporaceae bacterium]
MPLYLKHTKKKDPKEVVIDEALGQWIALIGAGTNPLLILLAFLLFRFFDILKPWPICKIDALGGSQLKTRSALFFDDVVAGLCASGIILFILKNFIG